MIILPSTQTRVKYGSVLRFTDLTPLMEWGTYVTGRDGKQQLQVDLVFSAREVTPKGMGPIQAFGIYGRYWDAINQQLAIQKNLNHKDPSDTSQWTVAFPEKALPYVMFT